MQIRESIEYAQGASAEYKKTLKFPHELAYEKTIYPFILLSKKRYVGFKYTTDDVKYSLMSMGVVLKRRDNAEIVKIVYGGVIDMILKQRSIEDTVAFLHGKLDALVHGELPISCLQVSKSVKSSTDYKAPAKIAHRMLADRMTAHGQTVCVGDRIPYVYVVVDAPQDGKKLLQGEMIEHPEYALEHGIAIDFRYYITNQIMKPVCQLLALVLDRLPGYNRPDGYWQGVYEELLQTKGCVDKANDKLEQLKDKEVEQLLFAKYLPEKKTRAKKTTDADKPKAKPRAKKAASK